MAPHGAARSFAQTEQAHGPATAVGLGAPGIARPDGRGIWWMQGRLSELDGLDWAGFLGRERVPVLNDAQAAPCGRGVAGGGGRVRERDHADARHRRRRGGDGGRADPRGRLGRAGHLGHISLDPDGPADIVRTPGSLEHAIGNCTIAERTGGRFTSTLALAAAAAGGDKEAAAVWSKSVRAWPRESRRSSTCSTPRSCILGGGIAAAGEALFEPLRRVLDEIEWRPHGVQARIEPARLGEYAGALGAAWNAM